MALCSHHTQNNPVHNWAAENYSTYMPFVIDSEDPPQNLSTPDRYRSRWEQTWKLCRCDAFDVSFIQTVFLHYAFYGDCNIILFHQTYQLTGISSLFRILADGVLLAIILMRRNRILCERQAIYSSSTEICKLITLRNKKMFSIVTFLSMNA